MDISHLIPLKNNCIFAPKIYRMRYIMLGLLIVTLMATGCSSTYSIEGKIEGMPEQKFTLEELALDEKVLVDSGKTDAGGVFSVKASTNEEKLYRLRFAQGKYILLALQNGDRAQISGKWTSLEDYQVKGSPGSIALKGLLVNLRENLTDINTMQFILDSLRGNPAKDSMYAAAEADLRNINAQFMTYIKQFADTTHSVSSALFAVNLINPAYEKPFVDAFYKKISTRFPQSTVAKAFAVKYANLSQTQSEQNNTETTKGNPAPDFSASDITGKTYTLGQFKGKYVLLDFWASWCAPCRAANPDLVSVYKQFGRQNFVMLGISLDSSKEKWIEAIQKDGLSWIQLSELKGWGSAIARNYQVSAIPANFLIDPQGNIIASGLFGKQLSDTLATIFNTVQAANQP